MLGLRADGGPGRGVGHLNRCLALAQAWIADGGAAVLASNEIPDVWVQRYEAESVDVVHPGRAQADLWVIDGYDLDAAVARGRRHVRIDDHHQTNDPDAWLVVDQNLGAEARDYPQPPGRLLLGLRHALIRRELVAAVGAPSSNRAPHVLVARGGTPSAAVVALTDEVVGALGAAEIECTVWTGSDDPIPGLQTATVALAAAGSTLWELALFGIPAVVLAVAPNQVPLASAVVDQGLALTGGWVGAVRPANLTMADAEADTVVARVRTLLDEGAASDRTRRLRQLVDGRGAARVAERLRREVTPARTTTT